MKNYWILARLMLKNTLAGMNPFAASQQAKSKGRSALRGIGMIVILAMAAVSVIFLEHEIFTLLRDAGQAILLPAMAILLSMLMTLVMGLFQTLSELFQGKDSPFLAVLPLTSRQIFAARLTSLYVSELALNAVIILPAVVMYCIGTKAVLPMALTAIPVVLLTPVLPLAIVALIASLLMRISFFAKHREAIVMGLSVAVALAYSIGVTMMNASSGDKDNTVFLAQALMRKDGMMNMLLQRFPPALWLAKGLTGDWALILLAAAVSVGAAALVIGLCGPGYLAQALSSGEKTVTRGKRVRGETNWRAGSRFAALHSLEWRELLRTPAWAYNALLGVVMFPLMIGIGFVAGFSRAGEGLELLQGLWKQFDPAYVALVTAAVMAMGSMVNPAVSTAISREGGRWPFALTLPVRQQTRFAAKLAVGIEINMVCSLMVMGVCWYLTRLPLQWMLLALLLAMLLAVASAAASLWVDALRPQLKWNSEMEAIKKNFNQVFGMLIWLAFTGLCALPAIFLWKHGGMAALGGSIGVAVVLTALSLFFLSRVTEKHVVLDA